MDDINIFFKNNSNVNFRLTLYIHGIILSSLHFSRIFKINKMDTFLHFHYFLTYNKNNAKIYINKQIRKKINKHKKSSQTKKLDGIKNINLDGAISIHIVVYFYFYQQFKILTLTENSSIICNFSNSFKGIFITPFSNKLIFKEICIMKGHFHTTNVFTISEANREQLFKNLYTSHILFK